LEKIIDEKWLRRKWKMQCITDRYHVLTFKKLRWLVEIILVFLSSIFLVVYPLPVYAQDTEIRVIPSSGLPGFEVTIDGTGFTESNSVTITIDDTYLAEVKTNPTNSNFVSPVSAFVPELPPGSYRIIATDRNGFSASASFTVLAPESDLLDGPDLTVSHSVYGLKDDEQVVIFHVEIENQGNITASETWVDIWNEESGLSTETSSIAGLRPGETTEVEVGLEIPEEWYGTGLTFLIEVTPVIREINEENNLQIIEVWVPDIDDFDDESRVSPWIWLILPIIPLIGGGLLVKRWLDAIKIRVRIHKDDIGIQQIEPNTPINFESEKR
jgi:hypothetical protein